MIPGDRTFTYSLCIRTSLICCEAELRTLPGQRNSINSLRLAVFPENPYTQTICCMCKEGAAMADKINILLAAVNARYIHTCPAIYSLKAYADSLHLPGVNIELAEFTINDRYGDVLSGILSHKADIIGFSTYIWNAGRIHRLIRDIRKIMPDSVRLWAGGPEAANDPSSFLADGADLCMLGEGELVFSELLSLYHAQGSDPDCFLPDRFRSISGITYMENGAIRSTGIAKPADIDRLPFPYPDLSALENRIIYYEASRGCPFACAYCLSGEERGVRLRDLSIVKQELQIFLDHKVRQVKFTDRTFNANNDYAIQIWTYLKENDNGITNFHFEIEANCLSDAQLALITEMRPGLIQLEIGVQSANPLTLKSVRRNPSIEKIRSAAQTIIRNQNINLHLDLIAGLPFEDMESFRKSFNAVYSMRPHQLQVGFLKLLKGTSLYQKREKYGLVCSDHAPYEVLKTKWLSFYELDHLHRISDLVEEYVNSQGFRRCLPLIEELFTDPFSMFEALDIFERDNGYDVSRPSAQQRYAILTAFVRYLNSDETGTLSGQQISCRKQLSEKELLRLEDTIRFDQALHVHKSRRMSAAETFLYLFDTPVSCRFDYQSCSPVNKEAAFSFV